MGHSFLYTIPVTTNFALPTWTVCYKRGTSDDKFHATIVLFILLLRADKIPLRLPQHHKLRPVPSGRIRVMAVLAVCVPPVTPIARSERYQLLCFPDHTFLCCSLKNKPTGFCCTVFRSFGEPLLLLCTASFLSRHAGHTQLDAISSFQQSKKRSRKTKLIIVCRELRHVLSRNECKKKERRLQPRGVAPGDCVAC